eukprot:gene22406-25383_t
MNGTIRVCYSGFTMTEAPSQSDASVTFVQVNSTDTSIAADQLCQVLLTASAVLEKDLWQRRMCPDACGTTPVLSIPSQIIDSMQTNRIYLYADYAVTCSLTLRMIVNLAFAHKINIFEVIARRALVECREHGIHDSKLTLLDPFNQEVRRKVKAVVIWVGSYDNIELVHNQALMLRAEDFHGSDAVVGWAATDQLYDCTMEERNSCKGDLRGYKYLPRSDMRSMKHGWRCAQRRPLRALAHVLALFDAEYIVSLDDDTFINFPLLEKRYGSLLLNDMKYEALMMGEYQGRTGPEGHLTTEGIFSGGAGYILGKVMLDRLHSKEVYAAGHERWPSEPQLSKENELTILTQASDALRSPQQIKFLSVLSEGIELATQHCNNADYAHPYTCILSTTATRSSRRAEPHTDYRVVPLAVRLIDFCTNIMASPDTCMHSDHSLGRCVIHGARAKPVNLICRSLVPIEQVPASVHVGMCFAASQCNVYEQITCHRFRTGRVSKNGVITPTRTSRNRSHYRLFSS